MKKMLMFAAMNLSLAHVMAQANGQRYFPDLGIPGLMFKDGDETQIIAELSKIEKGLSEKLDAQNVEIKKHGETSAATSKAIRDLEGKYDTATQELKAKQEEIETKLGRLGVDGKPEERKSAGQVLIESKNFEAFKDAGGKGTARQEVKALTSAAASVGVAIRPQRLTEIIRPNVRLHVEDLLPGGTTTANAIEYPRELLFTNAAAPVAEGALKPESNITLQLVTAPVRTIAHWLAISKQMLDDAPALQSYIDTRLVDGLDLVEDTQLLYGDGTGQNLYGLIPQATAYSRATTGTKIDILRRAGTQVRLAEYQADGIILNPEDWEDIELQKDSQGRYLWTNVNDGGVQRLWRMPVVDTTAITKGDFLVGAFQMAAQLFDRQQATVEISSEDVDNFRKNMLTIRAEQREVLVVYRPQSFVRGTFPVVP